MVRALAIRQVFLVVDLLLAAAIVVAAVMVTQRLFASTQTSSIAVAAEHSAAAEADANLREVGSRAAYNRILQSGLFGPAGRWSEPPEPPAPPPQPIQEEVEDTALNLRLLGVSAVSPTDPLSAAIIQDGDQRNAVSHTFWPGDIVVEGVTLEEIHPRMVILLNQRKEPPVRERLPMDTDKELTPLAMNMPSRVLPSRINPRPMPPSNAATGTVELNRQEIMDELLVNYSDLVTKLRPEPKLDDQGNFIGLTAPNISEIPLAQKLGLQDGDVLQTVNGEKIDSEQKIMEIMARYQDARSFRIGILRNGQPRVINYRIN